ncbi:protein kinase [candidate division KSB1 bacterium]|nr:protein kinase [candidate division KSB1 bacterium]
MALFSEAKKINGLYRQRDWNGIVRIARDLPLREIDDIKVLNDIAVAYRRLDRIDEAFQVCQRIYSLYPEPDLIKQSVDPGIRYMRHHQILGEIYYLKGNYDEALKIFDKLKVLGDRFSDKFLLTAKIYRKQKRFNEAAREYRNMITQCPKRIDSVIKGTLELATEDPTNEETYLALYEAYSHKGLLKRVVADLETRLSRDDENLPAAFVVGYFLCFNGQPEKGIQTLIHYQQQHPQNLDAAVNLAQLFLLNRQGSQAWELYIDTIKPVGGKEETVLRLLEKITAQKVGGERAEEDLAHFYIELGHWDGAEEKYSALARTRPDDESIKSQLEKIYHFQMEQAIATDRSEDGLSVLQKLVNLRPEKEEYRQKLRSLETLIVQSKIDEIERKLKISSLPADKVNRLQFELAELYEQLKGGEKPALSFFQKVAQSDSVYRPQAILRVGLSFLNRGMVDLAFKNFNEILTLNFDEEQKKDFVYQIGILCEERGHPEKAREMYSYIMALDVTFQDVAQRLEGLPQKATPSLEKGKEIDLSDRYEEIEKIGEGGMGIIYRATDKILKRKVAIKMIKGDVQAHPEAVERFIREAQSASQLRHPGIVTIYDINIGQPMWIVMEFVEGQDLRKLMEIQKFNWTTLKPLAVKTCEALGHAHQHGVVHRDIKPDNIMVTADGQVKITDFGLAHIGAASALTQAGQALGTPWYMAPEQIRGHGVDHRADLYALGATFYEILVGRPPFYEGDVAYQQIHERPQPPNLLNPEIPQTVEAIILKCLEKSPGDRYQTSNDLIADLIKS